MSLNLSRKIITLVMLIAVSIPLCFAKDVIRYQDNSANIKSFSPYFIGLLKLVVEHSVVEYGEVELVALSGAMSNARKFASLDSDVMDILWTTTSTEREKQALAVKIPLLKGMFGYRALMIRKDDQAKFSAITSLQELAQLTAIQGQDWPEVKTMRKAGLNVATMEWIPKLYRLVSEGKVDYYPRSILEIQDEVAGAEVDNLAIESSIILKYQNETYFFVAKNNTKLAKRLEYGLLKSMENGSFEHYFTHYGNNAAALKLLSGSRRIFNLDQPSIN
ncbi:type 2 periplasmic-binding domain-containing protein [Paraglaciecola hydrolytica]|uniref:Uncharacterized protein n=1 Tax=Paraglaciecola hydrolytica TaxID=1799789 RepID=A0A136A548_9ALTE|nr:transporter substrate-binding domain-containing protein [Paraglaciecola hydrolytica]KXI30250.1 hypothetical protein AX660_09715 [Paraglaciecola hydrolytica]